jgi:TP901 family phage tail tape measure protein
MAGALTGLIGGGTIGGATVRLVLDSAQFNAGLTQAEGRLKGAAGTMQTLSSGMSRVGSALTRGVTVPLVAAGAVATKMALDFNKAFVQIQTLAAKGGHSIAEMKTEVLDLAKSTGEDPNGLATALYNVLSAGKAAASQAFPILTAAARGAAVGMGDVQDIAKLLVGTMNAYGPKTISASEAMDVLTQATHDSAAEADALASSLGPVIGVAAQVGVSFADVAAAVATATNRNISAERAATGLRFLLQSLAAPTQIAKDKLDQYGISVQDLGRMLSSEGLTGTLQDLAKTFDLTSARGQQAWKAVVGGARGAIIANTLVGKSAKDASAEVKSLTDSAGAADKAFKIWGATVTADNARALSKLKVAAIQLGQQLIPIFQHIVDAVTGLVHAFSTLSPSMQGSIVKIALFAALAGPLIRIGAIVTGLVAKFLSLGTAAKAAQTAGAVTAGEQLTLPGMGKAAAPAAAGGFGAVAAGIAAGVALIAAKIHLANIDTQNWDVGVRSMTQGLVSGTHSVSDYQAAIQQAASQIQNVGVRQDFLRRSTSALTAAQIAASVATKRNTSTLSAHFQQLIGDTGAYKRWGASIQQATNLTDQEKNSIASSIGTLKHYGGSLSASEKQQLAMAIAAGDASAAMKILKGAIDDIPKSHKTKIDVDTRAANAAVNAIQGKINSLHADPVVVPITYSVSGSPQGVRGFRVAGAKGGIFPMGVGGITQRPVYQFGEGGYSTFAGRGAEAVIPLNSRGIDILAKAVQKGGAGRSINVTINTQGSMNPEQLAASVSRHLSRTIREEALV